MADTSTTNGERPDRTPESLVSNRDQPRCINAQSEDISAVLHQYPNTEFPHLTRSTIPLLAYWREPGKRIAQVLRQVGLPLSPQGLICFEYPVASAKPRNKASFTDVMYLSNTVTIAFEGKWTESRYYNVATWLSKGKLPNRQRVLVHWLAHIQPYCREALQADSLGNTVYQMIHRTASACAAKTKLAGVCYQCFCDKDHDHQGTLSDIRTWRDVLQPLDSLKFFFQRIETKRTEFFRELESRIEGLDAVRKAEAIRLGLRERELFEFAPEQIIEV